MGTLKGIEIDYQLEYSTARKKLTTKGCDFDKLSDAVGLIYLNCEDKKWSSIFRVLLYEITCRERMTRLME